MSAPRTDPRAIRWVRFAADCPEHVLCLSDSARPLAEAAIRAARAWADDPTEERREAAADAAEAAEEVAFGETLHHPIGDVAYSAVCAAYAAYFADAAYAADAAHYAAYASDAATLRAHHFVLRIGGLSALPAAGERDWQLERLRRYGLQHSEEALV